ncbi:MAG: poly-gamma-glutamate synthase PgsB [Oscillospiraceae bacterium]|nr:poly-gamma-glutamate synthase PgsB [Oscillospiraceae bacterium]
METVKILLVVCIIALIPLGLAIAEKRKNERNLKKLEIRVNVNGIRGKSTATRMITSILQEAGYHVVGKTTGTAARMLYWNRKEEEEIVRKPRGVSIGEQIRVVNKAVKSGANALVCECMAVRPDYQKVYQHQIIKANVTVIVNVLEDHLDEMGPTLEQLAWAFGDTIPYNGIAVIPNDEFRGYFEQIAKERGSKVVVIRPNVIPDILLKRFSYKVFSNNCAVALATARALQIDDKTAIIGMLKARPDPGALRITEIRNKNMQSWFVNAFAANEPSSTLEIMDCLQDENIPMDCPVVVMNCRPDRVDRTTQFAHDCLPYMGRIHLLVIGEKADPIKKAYAHGKLKNLASYKCMERQPVRKIMEVLLPMMSQNVVIGIGNIHGIGEEFIHAVTSLNSDRPSLFAKNKKTTYQNVPVDADYVMENVHDFSTQRELDIVKAWVED